MVDDEEDIFVEDVSLGSSTESDGEGFIMVKQARDDGASGLQADMPNPPEEEGKKRHKKICQNPAVGSATDLPRVSKPHPIIT